MTHTFSLLADNCIAVVSERRSIKIICQGRDPSDAGKVRFIMYEDKTLVCRDCGNEFVFTAGEQEFYAEKGFENEPQRCKSCRDARKRSRDERPIYTAVCAACGGEAKLRFEPREGRPVYCSECFAKMQK